MPRRKYAQYSLLFIVLISLIAGTAGCSSSQGTVSTPATPTAGTGGTSVAPPAGAVDTPPPATLAPDVTRDLDKFQDALERAVMRHRRDMMMAAMGESIWIVTWNQDVNSWPSESAVDELLNNWMTLSSGIKFDHEKDITALLGGEDPLSLWGPNVKAVKAIYSTGWGLDGTGDAILIIAQHDDGTYFWDSILLGPFDVQQ